MSELKFIFKKYKNKTLSDEKLKELANIFRNNGKNNIADCIEAYPEGVFYVNEQYCVRCQKGDNILHVYITSEKEAWNCLCGREGDLYICMDCLNIVNFKLTIMS